jgi:hypothetical protein
MIYLDKEEEASKKYKHVLSTIVQMLDVITSFNFSDRSRAVLRNTSLAVTSQHSPQHVTCPPSAVVEPRAATDHAHSYYRYISL